MQFSGPIFIRKHSEIVSPINCESNFNLHIVWQAYGNFSHAQQSMRRRWIVESAAEWNGASPSSSSQLTNPIIHIRAGDNRSSRGRRRVTVTAEGHSTQEHLAYTRRALESSVTSHSTRNQAQSILILRPSQFCMYCFMFSLFSNKKTYNIYVSALVLSISHLRTPLADDAEGLDYSIE